MIDYNGTGTMFKDLPRSNTIVIDINAQGIMDIDPFHQRFKKEFPETMAMLAPRFMSGDLQPGTVIKNQENGYRVLCVVTRYARIGGLKDDEETVIRNSLGALEHVQRICGKDPIASNIMNKDIKTAWSTMHEVIKSTSLNWMVYFK